MPRHLPVLIYRFGLNVPGGGAPGAGETQRGAVQYPKTQWAAPVHYAAVQRHVKTLSPWQPQRETAWVLFGKQRDYWCHSLTVIFGFVCLSSWWFGCVCVCVRACVCVNGCHNTLDNLITRYTCRTLDDLWCFWKDFSETWWSKLRFITKAHVIYFHISPQACDDRNWGPLVTKLNSLDMILLMKN